MVFAVQQAALALAATHVCQGRKCLYVFASSAIANSVLHVLVEQSARQRNVLSKVVFDVAKSLAQMLIWAVAIGSHLHECEQVTCFLRCFVLINTKACESLRVDQHEGMRKRKRINQLPEETWPLSPRVILPKIA